MIHPLSLVIPALVLLPNLGFFLQKPPQQPPVAQKEPLALVIMERLGQIGVFLGPLFFRITVTGPADIAAVSGMLLMLSVYYCCWIRYFRGKGSQLLLFSPLFSIPVPLAVTPVIYFLLSAVILDSLLMAVAGLVLAAGHIPISYLHYRTGQ